MNFNQRSTMNRRILTAALLTIVAMFSAPAFANASFTYVETCYQGIMGQAEYNETAYFADAKYGPFNWTFGVPPSFVAVVRNGYVRYSDREVQCWTQFVTDPKWAHGPGAGMLTKFYADAWDNRVTYKRHDGNFANPYH